MSFLSAIKSFFGLKPSSPQPGDRFLNCLDCSEAFLFDMGEQKFFKSKGFTDPKRCPSCRKKVKDQMKKKHRKPRGNHRRHGNHNSLIDGRSPYADER